MKFTGIINDKTEKAVFGKDNTPKVSILVEEVNDNEYKTSIAVDFLGDEKVALVDDANIWDVVTVYYNIRANNFEGKLFNSINGWKIENQSHKAWPQSKDPTKPEFVESKFGE